MANWINQKVQGAVAGVGGLAGGAVNAVGNGVSGAGRGIGDSITSATHGWGDGVRSYGNNIKDSTKAGGKRVPTAGNPLGLSGPGASVGGKKAAITGTRGYSGTAANPLGLGKR
ncbi:hypothetical protein BJ546DRAFT_963428 [Cryomyces antarcticus]|uniref:Uncharacterized protein n=1 Tax=Cryomyces antarcticus TaxID=329879 RepID=A0ABR0M7K9_9PEZI|nr:hypothetical protein LTR39_003768 [Cryomyces antarcticus]KAK5289468.1 hypothetical protein LTR16_002895 [Cryomyces antarcticus]